MANGVQWNSAGPGRQPQKATYQERALKQHGQQAAMTPLAMFVAVTFLV